jgi:beta-mannanase
MKSFKWLIFIVALIGYSPLDAQKSFLPVNPNAAQGTKQVLASIYKIREQHKILSVQHIYEGTKNIFDRLSEYKHIHDITGKYPAILGVDLFVDEKAAVSCTIQQWKRGGFVTITWDQSSPQLGYQGKWLTVASTMSDSDFKNMITPGMPLYKTWLDHIDRMAQNLKILQDSGVVVFWRPYHEMNGNRFWWCDKGTAFRQLWINMYDRFTNYHHLNNLIWVFSPSPNCDNIATYFPGAQYLDIGGLDIYNETRKIDLAQHDCIKKLMSGKAIALAETGLLPPAKELISKTEYVWFMPWTTGWCDNVFYGEPEENGPGNTAAILKEYYSNPSVVTLETLLKYK